MYELLPYTSLTALGLNNSNSMAFDFGSMLAGAGTSLFDFGLSALTNKLNLKNQKKFFAWSQDRTNEMQLQNMLLQPQLQKQGLKNAGLNPAMLDGQFSNPVSAPQGSASNAMMETPKSDFGTFMQLRQQ